MTNAINPNPTATMPANNAQPGTGTANNATNPTTGTTPAATTPSELATAFNTQYAVTLTTRTATGQQTGSLSDALNDMSNILGKRQNRLRDISVAIANDATKSGSFNPLALQRLQIESSTNEQFSQLQKSIFEKMSGAISTWTQVR